MKYLVILADGMADYPIPELNHQTPMQYAHTPNIDYLAKRSVLGQAATIPDNFPPGSDVANLSVLGYDPNLYYTGRSPLEAVSMGISMASEDLALRCNLVTLSGEPDYEQKVMVDYSSGEISSQEAQTLVQDLQTQLGSEDRSLYPGVSYRNLMIWKAAGDKKLQLTPPHDITDQSIRNYLPQGTDGHFLLELMKASHLLPAQHPLNADRMNSGLRPANSIWFWGEGRKPNMNSFAERYQLKGSVVAAVDLVKGLGISAGLRAVKVEGATGGIETNFAGKGHAAIEELRQEQDFVYVHIESPDEAGHQGNLEKKIWSIEQIDKLVIGQILNRLDEFDRLRLLLLPDHFTPLSIKTHSREPVPFLLFDSADPLDNQNGLYDENNTKNGLFISPGYNIMEYFITGQIS